MQDIATSSEQPALAELCLFGAAMYAPVAFRGASTVLLALLLVGSGAVLRALGRSWLTRDVQIRSPLLGGNATVFVPLLGIFYILGGLIAVL